MKNLKFIGIVLCLFLASCSKKVKKEVKLDNKSTKKAAEEIAVSLQLNWKPDTEHGGYFHALNKGLYKEKGLRVSIKNGGPNTPVETLVAVGDMDFGLVNADKILAVRQNGIKIVGLMAPYQITPRCVLVHENSPFKTFEDIKDTTFLANNSKPYYKFLVHKYGFKGVKTIPYRGNPAQFLANKNYIIQGYINSEPLTIAKLGTKTRALKLADAGFNPYSTVLITSEKLLKEKPGIVDAVVKASQAGWLAYLENPQTGNAEIKKRDPEADPQLLKESAAILKDLMLVGDAKDKFGNMTKERWQELEKILVECKALKESTEAVESAFDTRYLK